MKSIERARLHLPKRIVIPVQADRASGINQLPHRAKRVTKEVLGIRAGDL